MRLYELIKLKTPEQLKLDQLRANRERATTAVQQERERQRTQNAQQELKKLQAPKSHVLKPIKTIGTIKPINSIKPT
jgi:hypothetical protein